MQILAKGGRYLDFYGKAPLCVIPGLMIIKTNPQVDNPKKNKAG